MDIKAPNTFKASIAEDAPISSILELDNIESCFSYFSDQQGSTASQPTTPSEVAAELLRTQKMLLAKLTPENISTLLSYITEMPKKNDSENRKHRFPMQAYNVLCIQAPFVLSNAGTENIYANGRFMVGPFIRRIITAKEPNVLHKKIMDSICELEKSGDLTVTNKLVDEDTNSFDSNNKDFWPLLKKLLNFDNSKIDSPFLESYVGGLLSLLCNCHLRLFEHYFESFDAESIDIFMLESSGYNTFISDYIVNQTLTVDSELFKNNRINLLNGIINNMLKKKKPSKRALYNISMIIQSILENGGEFGCLSRHITVGPVVSIIDRITVSIDKNKKIDSDKLIALINMLTIFLEKGNPNGEHVVPILTHFIDHYSKYTELLHHKKRYEPSQVIEKYLTVLKFMNACFSKGVEKSPTEKLPNTLIKLANRLPTTTLLTLAIEKVFTTVLASKSPDIIRMFYKESCLVSFIVNRRKDSNIGNSLHKKILDYSGQIHSELLERLTSFPSYMRACNLLTDYTKMSKEYETSIEGGHTPKTHSDLLVKEIPVESNNGIRILPPRTSMQSVIRDRRVTLKVGFEMPHSRVVKNVIRQEPHNEEPKKEEPKKEEPKKEEPKKEEPKQEESKQEEPKKGETKKEELKKEEINKEEPKKEEPKKEEAQKKEPEKEEGKKEEPKKEESKKEEAKKEELKKEELKKEENQKIEPENEETQKKEPEKVECLKKEPEKDEAHEEEKKKDEAQKKEPKKEEPHPEKEEAQEKEPEKAKEEIAAVEKKQEKQE